MDLVGTGFENYIVPIIAVFCIIVGEVLKRAATKFPNNLIPMMLGIVGVVLNSWLNGWAFDVNILVTGFVSGVAGTGIFEWAKHTIKTPDDTQAG